MSYPSDDLTPLFSPSSAGSALPMTYRQGVVMDFNRITLENTIRVGGTDLTNLPLLGIAEATTLAVGDVVGIAQFGSSWAIMGRFVVPASTEAADAISVTSANTYSTTVATAESTTSTLFTDLTTAGPTLTGVLIGPSGRCLVHITAILTALSTGDGGAMGYQISGATSALPGDGARTLNFFGPPNGGIGATRVVLHEGLNPGLHTFTAKYYYGGGTGSARFSNRNLTVVAL